MSVIPNDQTVLEAGVRVTAARTLVDILAETAVQYPDALALLDTDGGVSYRRLVRIVSDRASQLTRSGVRRGDRVGIRIPSGSRELYISILATLVTGAAYVPVDADDPEERARLVFGEAGVVGVIGVDGVLAPHTHPHSMGAGARPVGDGAGRAADAGAGSDADGG
ncbi:MAG: AMP-binding protein, partial [Microbacteriaceae bacterium]|nr:AMP-binding protein [Microbacteriaceae bacterium]